MCDLWCSQELFGGKMSKDTWKEAAVKKLQLKFKKTCPVEYGMLGGKSHSAWYGCFLNGNQIFHIHKSDPFWEIHNVIANDDLPTGEPLVYTDTLAEAKVCCLEILEHACKRVKKP
jgi:hypothetical protein